MFTNRSTTRFVVSLLCLLLFLIACEVPTNDAPTSLPPTPESTLTSTETSESSEPVELVIWAESFTHSTITTDPEGAGRYGLYLKEQFEAEHPGVTVTIEHQGWDETLRQNLFNALLAGTAPDIVVGENFFQQYAELGALVPLDDVIDDVKDDLIPGTYKAAQVDGSIYGLSAFTGVFAFERNCQVIIAAGLNCDEPPETWDELLNQAQQITESGAGDYYGFSIQGPVQTSVGGIFRIAVFLAQAGAPLCQDNCTKPYFNNPDAIPVLEFIRELHKQTPPGLSFNANEGQVYEQLFLGLSAYQIAGSWHPGWAKSVGCEDCRYSAVPIPEDGQPASIIVGNVIYAVLQQSEHPELAAEWVKFLVREDTQDLVYPTLGRLPSTRSALTKLRPNVDSATQEFIDQLLNNSELEILPQWRKDPQLLWGIYNDLLIEVLTTERPIAEIMEEAQLAAEKVIE